MDITGPAPVDAPVTEAAPVEVVKEDSLAPKFAQLAKKEKWARKLAEDAKKQMEDWKKEKATYESSHVPKSRIKEDFMTVMTEAGLNPDQIANILLSQAGGQMAQDPAVRELREELKRIKQELDETKGSLSTKEKTQYDQAVTQIRSDVTKLVNSNPDYETIKGTENIEKVVEYIEATYKEDGILLSVEDAAKEVEEALVEDTLKRFGSSKRLQERLKAQQAPEEPAKLQTNQKSPAKTLTNGMTPASANKVTAKDRYRRAIMRAQGLDPDAVTT